MFDWLIRSKDELGVFKIEEKEKEKITLKKL